MNTPLTTIMQKEVSRKEFLGMGALTIASVFGLGAAIKLLTGHSLNLSGSNSSASHGYGSTPYGR